MSIPSPRPAFLQRLETKLWVAILLPGLAILPLASWLGWETFAQWHEAEAAAHSMVAVSQATEVIHALQRERGFSVSCVASKGARMCMDRQDQIAKTDAALDAFAALPVEAMSKDVQPYLSKVLAVRPLLASLRPRVADFSAPLPEISETFSKTINTAISISSKARIGINSEEIANQLAGVLRLERWKETAGLERALGGVLLTAEAVERTVERKERFIGLDSVQTATAETYWSALPDRKEPFGATLAGFAKSMNDWRRIIRDGQEGSVEDWWKVSTQRLDAMEVELRFIEKDNVGDAEELAERLRIKAIVIFSFLGILVLIGCVALWWISRGLSRPLMRVAQRMASLSEGEAESPVPHQDKTDEIGQMAQAVEGFRAQTQEVRRLGLAAEEERERAAAARAEALADLASGIESSTGEAFSRIAKAGEDVRKAAGTVSEATGTMEADVASLSAGAQQTLANAESVSAAVEEMSASTREIASQVAMNASAASEAASAVASAEEAVAELRKGVESVGSIAAVIAEIAAQTNLLALNASIEAQRVGTAGKGFAVVAQSVKALARRSGEEAEGIAKVLADLLAMSQRVDDRLVRAAGAVRSADGISASIASATEEQSATTSEIARAVASSAQAAREMSERVAQVAEETRGVRTQAGQVPERLATMDADLRALGEAIETALAAVR